MKMKSFENDICKPVYVGTKSPIYLLSLVNKGQPVIIVIQYLLKGIYIYFGGVIL